MLQLQQDPIGKWLERTKCTTSTNMTNVNKGKSQPRWRKKLEKYDILVKLARNRSSGPFFNVLVILLLNQKTS